MSSSHPLDVQRLLQTPEGEELVGIDEWKKFWRERARNKRDGYPAVAGLDAWHPGWWLRTQADLRWVTMARKVGKFHRETGEWPRVKRKGVPEGEGKLGTWLRNQRRAKKNSNNGWSPERQAYLDQVAPGWDREIDLEAEWRARADAVGAFYRENDRWPRQKHKGVPEDEAELGNWLGRQRQAKRGKGTRTLWSPERQAYLDQVAPGWDREIDLEAEWRARADAVGAFYRENDRWPRMKRKGVPEDEGELGTWLSKQREAKRGKGTRTLWSPERQAYLDQVAPGWDREIDLEAEWRAKASAVGEFYQKNDHWPRQKGKGIPEDERKLGIWLCRQRQAKKNGSRWSLERQAYLDAVAPGWDIPVRQKHS